MIGPLRVCVCLRARVPTRRFPRTLTRLLVSYGLRQPALAAFMLRHAFVLAHDEHALTQTVGLYARPPHPYPRIQLSE
eukprot:3787422-Pleurochrysis_carterae.AAC.1